MGQLADQMERAVKGEQVTVTVVTQTQALGAERAGAILRFQFQAGEDGVSGPRVRHGATLLQVPSA
jgi:hypothetical protein